jgi:phosphoglycolate phosphatase-like HAD superfamily hydrolase
VARREKLPWGIVTNKPGFLTEPLLAALPELASCGVTVSADTLPVRKPDPAPMFFACDRSASRRASVSMWGSRARHRGWPQRRHAYRGRWLGLSQ